MDFRGEKRSNETHRSTTDPEARLAKKSPGAGAQLAHSGHVLMENRHGLCLDIRVARADGYAERKTAKKMLRRFRRRHRIVPGTLGGDAGYEAGEFLRTIEDDFAITPHVPISAERVVAEDADGNARRRMLRRMKTLGYRISQKGAQEGRANLRLAEAAGRTAQSAALGPLENPASQAFQWGAAYNLLRLAHLEVREAAA